MYRSISLQSLPSIKTVSFFQTLFGQQSIVEAMQAQSAILKFSQLSGEEQELVSSYLTGIVPDFSPNHPIASNLAYISFEAMQPAFMSRPTIALVDKNPHLVIGADSTEFSSYKSPLLFEKGTAKINGIPVTLDSIEYNDSEGKKIKAPVLLFMAKDRIPCSVSIKIESTTSYIEFKQAWESKEPDAIKSLISPLYQNRSNLSNMFSSWFQCGIFPQKGLLIKIIGGVAKRETVWEGKTLVSYQCRVDLSDYPPLDVTCIGQDGAGNKIDVLEPLNSVGLIYSNSNSNLGAYFNSLENFSDVSNDSPVYLWIQGKAKTKNVKHTPAHVVLTPEQCRQYKLSIPESLKGLLAATREVTNYDSNPL